MLRTIDKELALYFVYFILGLVCFMFLKPILDEDNYQTKHKLFGNVKLQETRASRGEILSWAEARENDYLSNVGLELLVASDRNKDTESLENCLQLLVGGYDFVQVLVPTEMSETSVSDKVSICTGLLNYHPSHYETNDPNWIFLLD